jgi:uncharacterized protein
VPNRLAAETSPYLRLHADDPVDWFPWGAEAFTLARESGRPIFLSVGYASCHWCHVMHRESFRDEAIATLLNRHFVSIKVDRESRPDVDEVYMAYIVASNGQGGWPMSVFLTPQLLPLYGGTYFPPESGYRMPSFKDVLETVSAAFEDRARADSVAEEALGYLQAMFAPPAPGDITADLLASSADAVLRASDPHWGGFGGAPKFPQAPVTDFLLGYHRLAGDERALCAVESELEGMLRGGIYDQAGGGLARYSVDEHWLVPHFEKMLYDNGQLLSTLAAAHAARPREEWAHAMRSTAEFLERDLRIPGGAYASSLSADTLGEEGATYVWAYAELVELLSPEQLALAETYLGVTPSGNWEGRSILTRPNGRTGDAGRVDELLALLLAERRQRPQPDLDSKQIVSWNALAALGLLDAGEALGDSALAERGAALVRLLLERAIVGAPGGGRGVRHLLASAPKPLAGRDAHDPDSGVRIADDAVALALAAARAYEVAGDSALLASARELLGGATRAFEADGVWYLTAASTELPVRPRSQHDSPTPTTASLAAHAALLLARATGDSIYRSLAESTLRRVASLAERSPFASGSGLAAMASFLGESRA